MQRLRLYLIGTIVVVVGLLGGVIATGLKPILGLDLQGGVSLVLAPVGNVKPGSLDVSVDIIRNRVDSLGVAEPEISRQGGNIVVDLPGVKERAKAERIVGQTAELRLRPVLANLPSANASTSTTTTTKPSTSSTTGGTTTTAPTTTTTVPPTTTTTTAPNTAALKSAVAACDSTAVQEAFTAGTKIPTTAREDDKKDACVVLPLRSKSGKSGDAPRLLLGPVDPAKVNQAKSLDLTPGMTGKSVDSAKKSFESGGAGYVVLMKLTGSGLDAFNKLAAASFPKSAPQNEVAIVLDGIVQSAPQFQSSSFNGDVQISGGFTSDEADELAKVINFGALPVTLKKLTTENVSPTLGKDQLRAGIAAGIIGLALVALYMLIYYRILGAVVILGLGLSAALLYALISVFGETISLTLTLAGVTGIIVSVGITVDSYVVYYERLKDEVRSGKTIRSSVDRGFVRAFRTILAADLVSFIGALALYLLAIGSVRGFAFYLGVSTILDLLIAYFFMHPVVSMIARRPHLVRGRAFGMATGLDVREATA